MSKLFFEFSLLTRRKRQTSAWSSLPFISICHYPSKSVDGKNIKIIWRMMTSACVCSKEKQMQPDRDFFFCLDRGENSKIPLLSRVSKLIRKWKKINFTVQHLQCTTSNNGHPHFTKNKQTKNRRLTSRDNCLSCNS